MPFKSVICLLASAILLASCSTKRNTVVSRAYHNLTARYNGYYYSNEAIAEGIYKIEKNNKDNFDKILPVYIYPSSDKAKATFSDFDRAIKKSSFCIQRHAIKDKKGAVIPSSGKWIDNNWINIGVSQFYKREIFSSLESFEYVARTFVGSPDKYEALMWIAKVNNEIGSVSSSEQIISLLKNERNLPSKISRQLPVLEADYYMRRGQYTEAVSRLVQAANNKNLLTGIEKSKRARYSFIIGQLYETQKDNKRAIAYYNKTIKMKPSYEMVFYSKIKIATLLDPKRTNVEKTKKDLLKMAREDKNRDYFDVIYFTLGEMEEKEKNIDLALNYYKKSAQLSLSNLSLKAQSYLKLGEINFDRTNYQLAGAYYDSAVVTLPKDHKNYENIVNRKKTLERLVGHIKTIQTEDSLQKLAKMDSVQLNKFIDKLIEEKEKEEERKKREAEAKGAGTGVVGTDPGMQTQTVPGGSSFYFYNPTTVAYGKSEFTKRWGFRKYEENWRISNKNVVSEFADEKEPVKQIDSAIAKDPVKLRQFYKTDIPFSDSAIAKSNSKIMDSYYLMGSLYKEELNNNKKAITSFEDLNKRFPENKYLLNIYYSLFRIYQAEKNTERAEFYKNKILNEFPDSEFAVIIRNPNAAAELNVKKSEVEDYYSSLYKAYSSENYEKSYEMANTAISKFGKNEYLPKFEFIRAMSSGKTKGIDTMELNLKLLVAAHPKSDIAPLANDVLASIKKQKNPEIFNQPKPGEMPQDTFTVNHDAEHFLIAVIPDNPKFANAFKTGLDAFNTKYFQSKTFNISSNLFGTGKQIVILKSFPNAQEVMSYQEYLFNDKDLFKGEVKKDQMEIYPILATNLPLLYKKKNLAGYKVFYIDNFSKFNPPQKQ